MDSLSKVSSEMTDEEIIKVEPLDPDADERAKPNEIQLKISSIFSKTIYRF